MPGRFDGAFPDYAGFGVIGERYMEPSLQ